VSNKQRTEYQAQQEAVKFKITEEQLKDDQQSNDLAELRQKLAALES
jgi:hypothetical protein